MQVPFFPTEKSPWRHGSSSGVRDLQSASPPSTDVSCTYRAWLRPLEPVRTTFTWRKTAKKPGFSRPPGFLGIFRRNGRRNAPARPRLATEPRLLPQNIQPAHPMKLQSQLTLAWSPPLALTALAKMPIFVLFRSLAPPPPPLPQGPALAMLREARAGNSHRGPQHPPTTPHEVSGQGSRNILSSGV